MQIVIPMSGVGQRFIDSAYKTPKPLIKVHGKPIIEYVINLFPGEDKFLFICNKDHLKNTEVENVLKKLKPNSNIVGIKKHKKGPVYAIAQYYDKINDEDGVIVSYCDFFMNWDYKKFKKEVEKNNYAGAVPAYTGFHPHLLNPDNVYAGMRIDNNNLMTDIKEKHCFTDSLMDCHHSAGIYYFRSGREMKKYFNELMEKDMNLNGEYYASLPFYLYKRDQRRVYVPVAKHFMQWGTPQDLEEYLAWANLFLDDNDLSEVPKERKDNIKVPYTEDSEEYKKSYDYWKDYFENYF